MHPRMWAITTVASIFGHHSTIKVKKNIVVVVVVYFCQSEGASEALGIKVGWAS